VVILGDTLSQARAGDRRGARDGGKLLAPVPTGNWKQIEKNTIKANMLLKTNDGNSKTNSNELKNEPKLSAQCVH
jgi:hypothetical protein